MVGDHAVMTIVPQRASSAVHPSFETQFSAMSWARAVFPRSPSIPDTFTELVAWADRRHPAKAGANSRAPASRRRT